VRTRLIYLAALVFITTLGTSCVHREGSEVSLDVAVHNATSSAYWVDLDWNAVPVGILPPGGNATTLDTDPPDVDTVTLDITLDANRQHHATIKHNVAVLRKLSPGHHKVIISIESETAAKLVIDGHETPQ
jgi:hypothetical protein